MNSTLRTIILTGIFATPFIPFLVFSSYFFPFITSKAFTFRIIIEIIFALYIILALRDQNHRPQYSTIVGAFLGFLVVMGLATVFAENPAKSFWSNFERMEGYVTLLHLFAYFVVLGGVMHTRALWSKLFQTSLFASALMVFYSFLQLAGYFRINQGGVRVDGTLGNATYLAIYLVFHIFLALIFLTRRETATLTKWFYGLLIIGQVIVLYYTATRGAILGLIGGLFVTALLIALFDKGSTKVRLKAWWLIISLVALTGGFIAMRNTSFVQNSPVLARFAQISWNENKTQSRSYVWPMAVKGFKDRPLLGWGQENFNYVFNKYYAPEMYNKEPWFDRTHNVFLDWLIAGGILGLLAYLSLFGFGLLAIWKQGDFTFLERALLTGMFVAYLFHNIFVFDNLVSYMLFMMFLAYLHFDVSRPYPTWLSKRMAPLHTNSSVITGVWAPLVVVVFIGALYTVNIKPMQANAALITALQSGVKTPEQIVAFKEVFAYQTFADQEAREQLMQAVYNKRYSESVSLQDKQAIFTLAKDQYDIMIKEAPNDARHRLFYGAMLNAYGLYPLALEQLKVATTLSPTKQNIFYEKAVSYQALKDYASSLNELKQALDLVPENEEARVVYAIGAIYAGQVPFAKQLLKEGFNTENYPNDRLIQAYIDTNHFPEVVAIGEEQVRREPALAQNHFRLANSYYKVGRFSDAIRELEKAITLETNDNTKAQYQGLIDALRAEKKI